MLDATKNLTESLAERAKPTDKPKLADKMKVVDMDVFYGNFQAIKNANLDIPGNKVMALIGPSGCGKSTFLRALNRMHDLTPGARVTGSVTLDGTDIYASNLAPIRFQSRSSRMSCTARRSTASVTRSGSSKSPNAPCARPRFGKKSRTGSAAPRSISPAASNNASASLVSWRSNPK
jgi:energy-coupling factor transporter ATP-binding protein EcfA2